jgi:hypothetical protein
MNDYQDFSSLPPQAEQEFVPFERHTRESARSAKTIGIVVGLVLFVVTIVVVRATPKSENQHVKDLMEEEKSLTTDRVGPEGAADKPATAPPADTATPSASPPAATDTPPAAATPAPAPAAAPTPPPAAQ